MLRTWGALIAISVERDSLTKQNIELRDPQIFLRERGKLLGHFSAGRRQRLPPQFAHDFRLEPSLPKEPQELCIPQAVRVETGVRHKGRLPDALAEAQVIQL